MKKPVIFYIIFPIISGCLFIIWAVSNLKMHDFEGRCLTCHVDMPDKNKPAKEMTFTDEIDKLCSLCHTIDQQKSHPIRVMPQKDMPLSQHLDKNGLLTCTTCHDVHKENKTSNKLELSGLLWGHAKGRSFCALCHDTRAQDATFKHQTAIPYAHSYGKLTQEAQGGWLDKYSTECLGCHDDTISQSPQVEVRQGLWQHSGIGESHPIGVEYPRSDDFAYPESLPKEIRLFDQKVGCLSCHEIYSKEHDMLAMNNHRSRMCLACHKK